jgi:hypothetical protein
LETDALPIELRPFETRPRFGFAQISTSPIDGAARGRFPPRAALKSISYLTFSIDRDREIEVDPPSAVGRGLKLRATDQSIRRS